MAKSAVAKTPGTYMLPLMGFILAAILLTPLSSFVLFIPYFVHSVNASPTTLLYYGTLVFFAGMPFGKIIGRSLKLYRHAIFFTIFIVFIISLTVFLMPFITSITLLLLFRFAQGSSTILMEVFSVSYSYIYSRRTRVLASTLSISGIPAGVAIGSNIAYLFVKGIVGSYLIMGSLSIISAIPFLILLKRKSINTPAETAGTTFRRPITWALGFLWMTIAGFNLILASILPPYMEITNQAYLPAVMDIFGFWGAAATALGGVTAYMLYPRLNGDRSLVLTAIAGYLISFPGFLIMYSSRNGAALVIGTFLIMFETFSIAAIYALPRRLYEDEMVAKGTWEFGLVGSSGHIIAPLTIIPLALLFGYNRVFLILIIFAAIGLIIMSFIPHQFRPTDHNRTTSESDNMQI